MGCSCPSKGCGECLSTLVPSTGRCTSKQHVSKSHVWKLLIAKHPVISWELLCKRGVQAIVYATLRSQLYSLPCTLRGNHPPGCEGHKVYLPQLRHAPIVKVLYKQANIGFTAEAVFFGGGGRGRFAQKRV